MTLNVEVSGDTLLEATDAAYDQAVAAHPTCDGYHIRLEEV